MADTLGHSPARSASNTRNSSAALAVFLLALAPQIFELLWSIGTILMWAFGSIAGAGGRNPMQVVAGHGTALLFAAPSLVFGGFAGNGKTAFASDTLLALIYTYPLFAVALLTLFVSLAILSFAITIRPLGLLVSAFASFIVSALGTPETKWKETIIVGICLTIGCSLLFPYALGLPLQLFPRFLVQ